MAWRLALVAAAAAAAVAEGASASRGTQAYGSAERVRTLRKLLLARVPVGKMDECLTFAQSEAYLRDVADAYPDVMQLREMGRSFEDNPMTGLCMGAACFDDSLNVPEAFINGMHHSRECISTMSVLYALEHLLQAYEAQEPWVLHMFLQRKVMFLPIVNPDGYLYNERVAPKGGGNMRKNRNGAGCSSPSRQGVDLNRNYPTCWTNRDNGASDKPCAEDYKGPAPFSEPETKAIKKLIEDSNFTVAFNMHSYGRMLLIPYACKSHVWPSREDTRFFGQYANELARKNKFVVGRPWQPAIGLYPVNGDAADWMFEEHGIFAVSPEVGGGDFWLEGKFRGKGVEFSKENTPMLMYGIWASGPLLRSHHANFSVVDGLASVAVDVVNAGTWHSQGSVTIVVRTSLTSVEQDVGPVPFKYGRATASFTLPAAANLAGFAFSVRDSATCVAYTVADEVLEPLRASPAAAGQLSVPLETTVFTARFSPEAIGCTHPGLGGDPRGGEPGQSGEEGAKKESSESSESSENGAGFDHVSEAVYAHPIVPVVLLFSIAIALVCCLSRRRNAYHEIREPKGDDDV